MNSGEAKSEEKSFGNKRNRIIWGDKNSEVSEMS